MTATEPTGPQGDGTGVVAPEPPGPPGGGRSPKPRKVRLPRFRY